MNARAEQRFFADSAAILRALVLPLRMTTSRNPVVPTKEPQPDPEHITVLDEVVGYLNFSSGTADLKFLRNINQLFRSLEFEQSRENSLSTLCLWLDQAIHRLQAAGGAFADVTQANSVVSLLQQKLLPAYLEFHRNLLFHQQPADLWRPFFLGRAIEALLAQGSPWDESERIVEGALAKLNDFVGYRPVATLASGNACDPYPHEFVRPIPLYIRDAGVAVGRYEKIIQLALDILKSTDEEILARAWFDLDRLEEIALDPRAYDFDHPVNRRPNHHFGQWDPHHISNSGFYTRFVLQQITARRVAVALSMRSRFCWRQPRRPLSRGSDRLSRHDLDGLRHERRRSRATRFDSHAFYVTATHRIVSRRFLSTTARPSPRRLRPTSG